MTALVVCTKEGSSPDLQIAEQEHSRHHKADSNESVVQR
jgi:hypothetical protein